MDTYYGIEDGVYLDEEEPRWEDREGFHVVELGPDGEQPVEGGA